MRKRLTLFAIGVPGMLLLAILVFFLPPVHSRVAWRIEQWQTELYYKMNPPQEAVFIPQEQVAPIVESTLAAVPLEPTPTPQPPSITEPGPTPTLPPTPVPTLPPTPLPGSVRVEGVKYEDQHNRWNYCGPANLSMSLTFWGWNGNRDVVGKYIKPNDADKNVMPYEMQSFVETQTQGLALLIRSGGDIDLLKRLLVAGFPVLAEKGYYEYDYTGTYGWFGHYQFVTGYDDVKGVLIVQDTYIKDGKDHEFPYQDFMDGWRSFNYLFMVVYPVERQSELVAVLGPWADPAWADNRALEVAQAELQTHTGVDEYFAWFNKGTSHVNLFQYHDAALAYDRALALYASLPNVDLRPYRMLWYQTGPYKAYYYTGRYQDLIDLADLTLTKTIKDPVLEESFYWRGLAKEGKGDIAGAIQDLEKAVELNYNFGPGIEQLKRLKGLR